MMKRLFPVLLCMVLLASCANSSNGTTSSTSESSSISNGIDVSSNDSNESISSVPSRTNFMDIVVTDASGKLIPYSDVRGKTWGGTSGQGVSLVLNKDEYIKEDIPTYTFNESTTFEGSEDYQREIMEMGKDPGLGIRSLHEQGITGDGVNVAIIDQPLILDHPELEGKIAEYSDANLSAPQKKGSMHGAAVASLLVGNTVGIAPGAKLYFSASPGGKTDSKYCADSLYWIIEENKKLPEGQKIRVVSVSAVLSGEGSRFRNGELWDEAVVAAEAEGILVIDASCNKQGFILPGYFTDPFVREKPNSLSFGYMQQSKSKTLAELNKSEANLVEDLIVPTAPRTTAEEYSRGQQGYAYYANSQLSFAIPYAAGVLALGWQVNPDLDGETMKGLLLESAYVDEENLHYIDPVAFIEAVYRTVSK